MSWPLHYFILVGNFLLWCLSPSFYLLVPVISFSQDIHASAGTDFKSGVSSQRDKELLDNKIKCKMSDLWNIQGPFCTFSFL